MHADMPAVCRLADPHRGLFFFFLSASVHFKIKEQPRSIKAAIAKLLLQLPAANLSSISV